MVRDILRSFQEGEEALERHISQTELPKEAECQDEEESAFIKSKRQNKKLST